MENENKLSEREEKAIWFIRAMYWVGICTTAHIFIKFIIFVSTYDFCPLYYGITCLAK